jgi:hypothetical protein
VTALVRVCVIEAHALTCAEGNVPAAVPLSAIQAVWSESAAWQRCRSEVRRYLQKVIAGYVMY